jgi:hypothetical protein
MKNEKRIIERGPLFPCCRLIFWLQPTIPPVFKPSTLVPSFVYTIVQVPSPLSRCSEMNNIQHKLQENLNPEQLKPVEARRQ